MSLYNFAWTGMYSRDWALACEFWIATRIKTRFIVHSDDDAILCAQTLTRSLGLLPVPTHGIVLGWDLWDGFDNCFILVSRDVVRRAASFLPSDVSSIASTPPARP